MPTDYAKLDEMEALDAEIEHLKQSCEDWRAQSKLRDDEIVRLIDERDSLRSQLREQESRRSYAHMCRDEHSEIGHNESDDDDRCPLCLSRDEIENLCEQLRECEKTLKNETLRREQAERGHEMWRDQVEDVLRLLGDSAQNPGDVPIAEQVSGKLRECETELSDARALLANEVAAADRFAALVTTLRREITLAASRIAELTSALQAQESKDQS